MPDREADVIPPIVITGVGLVTPLGRNPPDTWAALLAGRHIDDHARLDVSVWPELPRVCSLAVEAATQAVTQAGWADARTAVVACTSKGPVEEWTAGPAGRAMSSLGYGMAPVAAAVSAALGLTDGPRLTISAACAGGLQAVARAALLITAGEADRVLVVAAEASVLPMFVASFDRLGVLPPHGDLCRPFDVDRRGFLMSEAAAAVCLEPRRPAGLPPLATLDRFALGGDASHLTGVDRGGLTLRRLLARVAAGGTPDLVHAHGTGTELNDAAELAAIAAALPAGGAGATLYSHKAALGHSLGASGLVALVLSCLAHGTGTVPPNVNTRRPMPTSLELSRSPINRAVRRSLTTAAGFGGGVAVVGLTST